MARLLLVLDDDRTRLRGFDEIVPRLGSDWTIRAWRDAPSMMAEIDALLGGQSAQASTDAPDPSLMAEIDALLGEVHLISLDHDLYRDSPSDPDPGSGRMIADHLSGRAPVCPVIIHSTNADAAWGMFNELTSRKWKVELVHHLNQPGWIEDTWLPVAAKVTDRGGKR